MLPDFLVETALALAKSLAKLLASQTAAEQEEALMLAAEATKAALDRLKFGG